MKAIVMRWSRLRATAGERIAVPWEEFLSSFREPGPWQGDESHPGWSAADLDPPVRADANVRTLTALVLDYDKGHTIEAARELWGSCFGILHTTRKHRTVQIIEPSDPPVVQAACAETAPDGSPCLLFAGHTGSHHHHSSGLRWYGDRFRAIVPFLRPVLPAEYRRIWRWSYDFTGGAIDPSPKDLSRFWYLPGATDGYRFEWLKRDTDRVLDPDGILAEAPEEEPERPRSTAIRSGGGVRAYADAALRQAAATLRGATRGERNTFAAREAYSIGGLVGSGELAMEEAFSALHQATREGGWDAHEDRRTTGTLRRQLEAGARAARRKEDRTPLHIAAEDTPAVDWFLAGPTNGPPPPGPTNGSSGNGHAAEIDPPRLATPADDGPRILSGETGAELAEPAPPIVWICEGLHLTAGRPNMLAAYAGSGKTFLIGDVALAVASGGRAWGTFATKQGPVLHLNFEMERFDLRRRYQRLAYGRRLDLASLPLEVISRSHMKGWNLSSPNAKRDLMAMCRGVSLLVIDSLRAGFELLTEDRSEARFAGDMLLEVSEETRSSIMVLHHAPKPSGNGAPSDRTEIHDARGHSAIMDSFATSWHIRTGEAGSLRIVMGKRSQRTDSPSVHVRLVDSGPIVPEWGLSQGVAVEWMPDEQMAQLQAQREAEAMAKCKRAILKLLSDKGPMAKSAIKTSEAFRARKGLREAAMEELISSGSVTVSEGPRGSRLLSVTKIDSSDSAHLDAEST